MSKTSEGHKRPPEPKWYKGKVGAPPTCWQDVHFAEEVFGRQMAELLKAECHNNMPEYVVCTNDHPEVCKAYLRVLETWEEAELRDNWSMLMGRVDERFPIILPAQRREMCRFVLDILNEQRSTARDE